MPTSPVGARTGTPSRRLLEPEPELARRLDVVSRKAVHAVARDHVLDELLARACRREHGAERTRDLREAVAAEDVEDGARRRGCALKMVE